MNNDFKYMKFIYLQCGEETNLREKFGIAEVMGSTPVRA